MHTVKQPMGLFSVETCFEESFFFSRAMLRCTTYIYSLPSNCPRPPSPPPAKVAEVYTRGAPHESTCFTFLLCLSNGQSARWLPCCHRLDHTRILGDTVEEIAGEKAGIFKPGVPALVGEGCAATEVLQVGSLKPNTQILRGQAGGCCSKQPETRADGRGWGVGPATLAEPLVPFFRSLPGGVRPFLLVEFLCHLPAHTLAVVFFLSSVAVPTTTVEGVTSRHPPKQTRLLNIIETQSVAESRGCPFYPGGTDAAPPAGTPAARPPSPPPRSAADAAHLVDFDEQNTRLAEAALTLLGRFNPDLRVDEVCKVCTYAGRRRYTNVGVLDREVASPADVEEACLSVSAHSI